MPYKALLRRIEALEQALAEIDQVHGYDISPVMTIGWARKTRREDEALQTLFG